MLKRLRTFLRWFRWLLTLLAATLGVLLYTPMGGVVAPKLIQKFTGGLVVIDGMQGSLAGPFTAKSVRIKGQHYHLLFTDVHVDWNVYSWLWAELDLAQLNVKTFQLSAQGSGKAPEDPSEFLLPFPMHAQTIQVQEIYWHSQLDLRDKGTLLLSKLSGQLETDGVHHKVNVTADRDVLVVDLNLSLQGDNGMPLEGKAKARFKADEYLFSLSSELSGSLPRIQLDGKVSGIQTTGHVNAYLTLYQAHWLESLNVTTEGINLADIISGAPQTNLIVVANTHLTSATALTGTVAISNNDAGRIDQGKLPFDSMVAVMDAELSGFQLSDLVIQRGNGVLRGNASFADGEIHSELDIQKLDLSLLHHALMSEKVGGLLTSRISPKAQKFDLRLRQNGSELIAHIENTPSMLSVKPIELKDRSGSAFGEMQLQWNETQAFDFSAQTNNFTAKPWFALDDTVIKLKTKGSGVLHPQWKVNLDYEISDSRLEGRPISGMGTLNWASANEMAIDARLNVGNNTLFAKGELGRADSRLDFDITAPDLKLPFLRGELFGEGYIGGVWKNPFGEFKLHTDSLLIGDLVRIENLNATSKASLDEKAPLLIDIKADTLFLSTQLRLEKVDLELNGTRANHRLKGEAFDQNVTWKIGAEGGLKNRIWSGNLTELHLHAIDTLTLNQPTTIELGENEFSLGASEFSLNQGLLNVEYVKFKNKQLKTKGKLESWPITQFLPAEFNESDLRVGGTWNIEWGAQPIVDLALFKSAGDLRWRHIKRHSLGIESAHISATSLKNNVQFTGAITGSTIGQLHFSAESSIPDLRRDIWSAPITSRVDVESPDIAWIGPVVSQNFITQGRLTGILDVDGSLSDPLLDGYLQGTDLAFVSIGTGLRLKEGTVNLTLNNEALTLHTISFTDDGKQIPTQAQLKNIGAGGITGSGQIKWKEKQGALQLQFDRLGVMQLPQQWMRLSGDTKAIYNHGATTLSGNLKADGGSLTLAARGRPSLSEDVEISGENKAARASNIKIEMTADLGDRFYFSGSGLESRLAGKLRFTALPGNPLQANGTISTVGGAYEGYGQKLDIERGNLFFQGIIDNPGLDVKAMRKSQGISAGVEVTGTVMNPVVKLISDPDLPDAEKLSWLVLGKGLSEGSAGDISLLIAAGSALINDPSVAGGFDLKRSLGVDIGFRTGRLDDRATGPRSRTISEVTNDNGDSASIVTLSKELTRGVHIGFEQIMNTNESVLKLSLALGDAFTLETRSGEENSIDLFYTISFGK